METDKTKAKECSSKSPDESFNPDTGNIDEIIVTYETLQFDNEENPEIVFQDFDEETMVDVDCNMYGGPLPEYFLIEENDLPEYSDDPDLFIVDDIDSVEKPGDDRSDKSDDFEDYYI